MSGETHELPSDEQFERLQSMINEQELSAIREMSESEKRELLASLEFYKNNHNYLVNNAADANQNPGKMSYQDQLEIQRRLSEYDNTLKETLDAINNGQLNDDLLEPIFKSLPSDSQMNQLLKEMNLNNVQKLRVGDDLSVRLESSHDPNTNYENKEKIEELATKLDQCTSADEYIEKMIKIINQNKKFDNFLEEVSKIENLTNSDNLNLQLSSPQYNVKEQNSEIENPEKDSKQKINLQINKAMNILRFNDQHRNSYSKFDNDEKMSLTLNSIMNDLNSQVANGEFSLEEFNEQLIQQHNQYLKQRNHPNAELLAHNSHEFALHHVQNYLRQQGTQLSESEIQSLKSKKQLFLKPQEETTNQVQESREDDASFGLEYVESLPTPEQKDKLRKDTLDILRMQDAHFKEANNINNNMGNATSTSNLNVSSNSSSKKKAKKKKKKKGTSNNSSNAANSIVHGNHNNDMWLCGLCEYKIVYGEVPIYIQEAVQKDILNQEKRETYQRYLMSQRQERKHMQRQNQNPLSSNQSSHHSNHDHDEEGNCQHKQPHTFEEYHNEIDEDEGIEKNHEQLYEQAGHDDLID